MALTLNLYTGKCAHSTKNISLILSGIPGKNLTMILDLLSASTIPVIGWHSTNPGLLTVDKLMWNSKGTLEVFSI